VLAPPDRPIEAAAEGVLPGWRGSPLDPRNRGAWIDAGAPLAVVAAPGRWVAWAGVDQADAPAVEPGQPARVLVEGEPASMLTGQVVHVSRRARDNHAALGAPARRDDALVGEDRYHVVEIALVAPPELRFAGARGTAKIATQDATLGELAMLRLRRLFTSVF
jgi:putative peptide zinc metalloprotease protein